MKEIKDWYKDMPQYKDMTHDQWVEKQAKFIIECIENPNNQQKQKPFLFRSGTKFRFVMYKIIEILKKYGYDADIHSEVISGTDIGLDGGTFQYNLIRIK